MKITVSHVENHFNRATRENERYEVTEGFVSLPDEVEHALRRYAPLYRFTVPEMVRLALVYYYGDGENHFYCEHCDFYKEGCELPEVGEKTTVPLLDKGTVVVGLPDVDLGE